MGANLLTQGNYELARDVLRARRAGRSDRQGRDGISRLHADATRPHDRGDHVPESRGPGAVDQLHAGGAETDGRTGRTRWTREAVKFDDERRAPLPSTALPATSVVRTRLANGLTVLIRRDPSAPVVAIVTYVQRRLLRRDRRRRRHRARARAHVLQGHADARRRRDRQADEGGRRLSQRRARSTITRATTRCCRRRASRRGSTCRPTRTRSSLIDADELARELEVIIQEAKRKADNPGAVATETLYELLHDRHRIRRWRIGREPGLRALDARRAGRASIATSIIPGNTVLIDRRRRRSRRSARRGAARDTARSPPASRSRTPGPTEEGVAGFRYRELDRRHRRRRSSRSAGARRARRIPTRPRSTCSRRCSAAGAHRDCIARCASGGSRRR